MNSRDQSFESDEALWAAVGEGDGWVVTSTGNVGETISMEGPDGAVELRVAGSALILEGIVAAEGTLAPFASAPRGVTALLDVAPGAGGERVAREVEAALFEQGIDAATTRELLDRNYRANRTFFSVVDVLMRMGLVVGILSMGIVALRAVVERRHVIGVLRAIGYRRRKVMAGLLTEAGVTASIGVVVGVTVGVVMGYIFFREYAEGTPFGIDGPSLWGALGLVYGAVALVSLGPAYRASRLPPAEAVRYSE
ncbi:MAG: FtsX-like permease family protein [Actinobacteria bacterium]|nr:FtsX-like permease family protein [Actinomycetota bacterium]